MKKVISTLKAPQAIGPYSQALQAGDFLFISGQLPIDPATGNIVEDDIEKQTHRVFKNINAILEAANLDFSDIVKTQVFLSDMKFFPQVNNIYSSYINGRILPARAAMQVACLPKNALIEIEAVAYYKK